MTDRYGAAGVRLDVAEDAKRRIGALVATTRTPLALGKIGAFGGMVRVPAGYQKPVLVLSTDGVGTKVLVAAQAGIHHTVGEDLVNHCVNDILVHGATPVAFLDYIAAGVLDAAVAAALVEGIARGCRSHHMTLAGGETAQLPDLYAAGHYDLAGTIVGVVDEDHALHGDHVAPGDVVVGYASNGLHTNGYTLARRIVFGEMGLGIDDPFPETSESVAQVLLAVHRSYAAAVMPVIARIHALAHITGG
ncbi:MAG TPA: phosphoribosylformylglycinamidine cyclo-ligase, partial [Gemmatimonadales bacterium]|nr:phosphoribosylformylglycinamidine cyclo-ligase [Gemmatimonadales bacterium]